MANIPRIKPVYLESEELVLKRANAFLPGCVGRVDAVKEDGTGMHGSCFIYSNTYYMITCAHLVADCKSLEVFFRKTKHPAKIVALDDGLDLAVIVLEGLEDQRHDQSYLKFDYLVFPGHKIFTAGYRVDRSFHIYVGNVASSADGGSVIVDCTSDNGMSGGPGVGRNFTHLFGVIRGSFGQTILSTTLIPASTILYFLKKFPHLPQSEEAGPP
jgi:S1-C subfamily serine protease